MAREHLKSHAAFLMRSADLFDQGAQDEALRMATSIRVLIHDTNHSHSIFKQLGVKDDMQLISTMPTIAEREDGMINILANPFPLRPGKPLVPLGDAEYRELLTVLDWWNQNIYESSERIMSRSEVVLSTANQDGGAHVDPNPSGETKDLKQSKGSFWWKDGDREVTHDLSNTHYALLRQFTYEILNSGDFIRESEKD